MRRAALLLILCPLLFARGPLRSALDPSLSAFDTNLTGEWAIQFTTPLGHAEYTLYLTQEGPRLNGHLTSEFGEVPVKGRVEGEQVTMTWTETDAGKSLDISVTATIKDNDSFTGTARLGKAGEGPFRAERTGS